MWRLNRFVVKERQHSNEVGKERKKVKCWNDGENKGGENKFELWYSEIEKNKTEMRKNV